MKKRLGFALLAAVVLAPAVSHGEEGNWLVRVRAVNIQTDASSSPVTGVDVENRWIPELDVSYRFARHWAAELVLTYPQEHDVTLNGARIGSVRHLPPTLLLQYHFLPEGRLRPYVGAGINYTRFSSVNLAGGALTIDRHSVGAALQVGVDFQLAENLLVNFDIKKVYMDTEVKNAATGITVTDLDIDPWLFGVGVGYRF